MAKEKIIYKTSSSIPLLIVILTLLKITNTIDITWFWVFSPIWLSFAITIVIWAFVLAIVLIIIGIQTLIE